MKHSLCIFTVFVSLIGQCMCAELVDSFSKEDMVKKYVKQKTYSFYPGVTQIRLGKKAKGYGLASAYTGTWIFLASYVGLNLLKYRNNTMKANDASENERQAYNDYLAGKITYDEYDEIYNTLFDKYCQHVDEANSNLTRAYKGLGASALVFTVIHLYDYFDSKKEFDSFYRRNRDRFNFSVDQNTGLYSIAYQFKF